MIDDSKSLSIFGMDSGFAFYEDFYINATADVTLDISDHYDITATLQHITGDPVMEFGLQSLEVDGKADIEVRNIQPESWYRLQFDGVLAKSAGGRAHGESTRAGTIRFNDVVIPNE